MQTKLLDLLKNQEVGVVFSGMLLPLYPANAWSICPHHSKKVLSITPKSDRFVDSLDMREPLLISANFILTFDDKNPSMSQNAMSFIPCTNIQIQDRRVPFEDSLGLAAIVGIPLIRLAK